MFKVFLLIMTFAVTSVLAEPRTINKPIVCEETRIVLSALLSSEYEELPIWMGNGENSRYSLLLMKKQSHGH